MDANGLWYGLSGPRPLGGSKSLRSRPRLLVIGAGSRGNAYARAANDSAIAIIQAIAEPVTFKREEFGRKYIWGAGNPSKQQHFTGWQEFLEYETKRRQRIAAGEKDADPGIDAALVCTLDEQHADIIIALAPLKLHFLSEKPLATTLEDCLRIYNALLPNGMNSTPEIVFSVGHVLRYSPHNMMLHKLLRENNVIGEIISIEHTEPVGWWHFSHSYVRGNWRREDATAPSLLTKSCHDVDFILWLLSSPTDPEDTDLSYLPTTISSTGHLSYFRKSRKPIAAGTATNCLSCPIKRECKYSAEKIYVDRFLSKGQTDWPVKIVNPEIEDCYTSQGPAVAHQKILDTLAEDYTTDTPVDQIKRRPWFGRCVWESDNDVCDDQHVLMTWEGDESDNLLASSGSRKRHPMTASFHMIAHSEAQCERRGVVYGTNGEIHYDSKTIRVIDFTTGMTTCHNPKQMSGGHGGGDDGLVRQFVSAVEAVKGQESTVDKAQKKFIGCTIEDMIRSHATVFAAEDARHKRRVLDWSTWWAENVEERMRAHGEKDWEIVTPKP